MVDVTGFKGEPWQVTMSRTGDGYVVHLIIAGVMIVLPQLEAHKLGSALQAASGINTNSDLEYLALVCVRCSARAFEGYRRDEHDHSFWCSKKCMAADGHDTANAYETVTELGEEGETGA